jgi:hypothetical protein
MADRTATQPRDGNGSARQNSDLDAHVVAQSVQRLDTLAPTPRVTTLTQRLNLGEQVAEARQRRERLEAALEKSTRRMQQLLGERDRLASLLAARDADVQRLQRELGALSERAAPAGGSPTIRAAASAMLDKIRHSWRPPASSKSPGPPAAGTERPSAERALVPWLKDGAPKPVLGVVVFGLSAAEIARVLGIVERHCVERDLVPLLLTDNDAFELFRGRRVLFEFLPAPAQQERFAADLDWRLFTLRRLALIRRKWQPVRIIAFGRPAAEVVQRWLDSPFEPTPIPAYLRGRSDGAELAWGGAPQPLAVRP